MRPGLAQFLQTLKLRSFEVEAKEVDRRIPESRQDGVEREALELDCKKIKSHAPNILYQWVLCDNSVGR